MRTVVIAMVCAALATAGALLLPGPAAAAPIVLYDAAAGQRPQSQGWMTYIAPLGPASVAVTGGVRVDTTNDGSSADDAGLAAGFFNHGLVITSLFPLKYQWDIVNAGFPSLDPDIGFRLGFQLALRDEDHNGGGAGNRAGFSVILLGADLLGIELGFWEDLIFAQSGPAFTLGESAPFDTTAGLIPYALTILGNGYVLSTNGKTILSGSTRDYSPATPFPDPYDTPNMLFLGDDTTSAAADFTLGRIWIETGPFPVPAPAAWPLVAGGVAWLGLRRRRSPGQSDPDDPNR